MVKNKTILGVLTLLLGLALTASAENYHGNSSSKVSGMQITVRAGNFYFPVSQSA